MDNGAKGDRTEVLLVRNWDTEEIRSLYREAGWWKEEWDPAHLSLLISGSLAFAVAVDHESGRAVAMGRVISDGSSDAYIQDMVVKSEVPPKRYRPENSHNTCQVLPGPGHYVDCADCRTWD